MKRSIKSLLATLVVFLSLAAPVLAGPWEAGVAAYKRGDYATAAQFWRPLAEQGFAAAQYKLGVMYQRGQGVPQDYAEALKWFRKAAEQGAAWGPAQFGLGVMYKNGKGVPQDFAMAIVWYRKAAEQGFAVAQNNLGVMYAKGLGMPQDNAGDRDKFASMHQEGREGLHL